MAWGRVLWTVKELAEAAFGVLKDRLIMSRLGLNSDATKHQYLDVVLTGPSEAITEALAITGTSINPVAEREVKNMLLERIASNGADLFQDGKDTANLILDTTFSACG
jgi:hypothetical protein